MMIEDDHAPPKDLLDEETVFELEDSLDDLPLTPSSRKNDADSNLSIPTNSLESHSIPSTRRDSRIKAETMLSRLSDFAGVTDEVYLENLFEYIWPVEDAEENLNQESSGTYYVVQELLADFLKIKSFKRRYPDLTRRAMDAYERSWLQQCGLVPAGRAELGLTAIVSDEVMTLLQNDFPEVHEALSDLFRQRRFQHLAKLQKKQYQATRIERGEARAEAARKRALESAVDFNRQLVSERYRDRRCYWDLQTMQIHVPKYEYRLIADVKEENDDKKGSYPVAVIPGQFTENYVDFSPTQLAYFPVGRALFTMPRHLPRPPAPLPTFLRYGNLMKPNNANDEDMVNSGEPAQMFLGDSPLPTDRKQENNSATPVKFDLSVPRPLNGSVAPTQTQVASCEESKPILTCTVCQQPVTNPLRCSQCMCQGHPKCLELPDSMVDNVRTYAWSCMECKHCIECEETGNEDQMMFCDQCDRGYHAYCVGLSGIPEGSWECPTCDPTSKKTPNPPPIPVGRRRSTTATPIKRSGSRASLEAPTSTSSPRGKRRGVGRPRGKRSTSKRAKLEEEGEDFDESSNLSGVMDDNGEESNNSRPSVKNEA